MYRHREQQFLTSENMFFGMQDDLALERQWYLNGRHYSATLEAWLRKHDAAK